MPSPSAHYPHRDFDQEAKDARIDGAPVVNFGAIYGNREYPAFISPEGPVWMWRKGQRVRFYTADGKQVGPEQSNVCPAICAAYAAGWIDMVVLRMRRDTEDV